MRKGKDLEEEGQSGIKASRVSTVFLTELWKLMSCQIAEQATHLSRLNVAAPRMAAAMIGKETGGH